MKNLAKCIVLFSFLWIFFLFPKITLAEDIVINEFVAYPNEGGDEWIELFNTSDDSSQDLTGWTLVINQGPEDNYTYHYSYDLSGTIPKNGFLTFTMDNNARIPNDGGCLILFISDTQSTFSVKYGNGVCDEDTANDATALAIVQGESIYAETPWDGNQGVWKSTSSPTKGWFDTDNSNYYSSTTIVNRLADNGITTNLGDQSDMSRTTGVYFTKTNRGKILFSNEINFTDNDVYSWLRDLDSKISISQGIISLDADTVTNLINTQAALTMNNISFTNPKILVDNQEDTEGIVSDLSYNSLLGTLTFTAAHFTTFTAAENTSSSSSSSNPTTQGCGKSAPSNAPNLFKIDTTKNTAKLYFSPVNDYLDHYFITYGYSQGDERFGVEYSAQLSKGVVDYTINCLSLNTAYYFKVRGGNGCATGPWSNSLTAKTKGNILSATKASVEQASRTASMENKKENTSTDSSVLSEMDLKPTITKTMTSQETVNKISSVEKTSFWQKIHNFFNSLLPF